ncbi:GGDEF domain-containing protein [Cohnella zeiphila]|uniref:GGDEF domain-containing protein n=1 Tax=Cohnella zeiphila TaxID=2761120 RepID=A0A7X0SL86_9BACL|nr:GGDEF domain-containing protein [Cohnella zeiphila]MBB6731951.1 GGDEF domain-containing protein [Cohnella zeiphila]
MGNVGRRWGCGLAVSIGAAAGALSAFATDAWTFAVCSGAGFAAALLLPGWLLGRKYDRVVAESERDCLTALFNRSFMERCFSGLSEQATRGRKKISVTLVDVNDFKSINDTYGHGAGDRVLVQLAKALQTCSDRGEIVGRWGGDEFVLLSPYAERGSSPSLHRHIAERMEQLSRQEDKPISVAVGTAVFPEDGLYLDELLHEADRRMYADKLERKRGESPSRMNA